MNESKTQSAAATAEDFTRTWRYKVGLLMIIIGNAIIVLSALVFPFLGMGAGTIGALVLGGEGLSLLSIVFLGKEGFKAIKNKIFGAVKGAYVAIVGRTRHYIGIILLCTNVATTYITAVYAWTAFSATTFENPLPVIWGLDFAQQGSLVLWLFLIGEISFLISIYVLGADWWGKFRNIFVWAPSEKSA
jgi:hypothetical protein